MKGEHPNAGEGLWGTQEEVPSFLYAMPVSDGRVFFEETCLVAKPALPFAVLKRRLHRRLEAMGITVRPSHLVKNTCNPTSEQLAVHAFCVRGRDP